MKTNNFLNTATLALMSLALSCIAPTFAAENFKSDEKTLRDLVSREDKGEKVLQFTEDAVFVSGRLARPIIGSKNLEARRAAGRQQLAKERPNEVTNHKIERIKFATSGDMAEEFGNFDISYDGPDKKRVSFEGSYLRVWQKVDGNWKVSSFFARPNQRPQDEQ